MSGLVDSTEVGAIIALLRKSKRLTQTQLAERLCVSPQAVSKWESGRALPDTALLCDLSAVLETTIDHLLNGGRIVTKFEKRMSARDIREGVDSLARLGNLIGRDNTVYEGMIAGVSARMNVDFQEMLSDEFLMDGLLAELVIQNWGKGRYVDLSEAKSLISSEHWKEVLSRHAEKKGMI